MSIRSKKSASTWATGKSLKYIDGKVVNCYRPKLNGDPRHCPRCGHLLFRDDADLACNMRCGWRESCYFKQDVDEGLVKRLMFNAIDVL
jgi:hypothetical protein